MKAKLLGISAFIVMGALSLGAAAPASALVLGINSVADVSINGANPDADSSIYPAFITHSIETGVSYSGYAYNNANPSISGDGRYIAFKSRASNIVSGTTNNFYQVYVKDRQSNSIRLVSVTPAGTTGNSYSDSPKISNDGRYVVFESKSSDLVDNDTNNKTDIFRRDLVTNTTTLISVNQFGNSSNGTSSVPDVSSDGNKVVFYSDAGDITPITGQVNYGAIYVRNISAGTTQNISKAPNTQTAPNQTTYAPQISCDGKIVTFTSAANNIVVGDSDTYDPANTAPRARVYIVDTSQQPVTPTYIDPQTNGQSAFSSVSCNGRYIVFNDSGTNLVPNDTNSGYDAFVYDRENPGIERVSVDNNGDQVAQGTTKDTPSISDDGKYVAFSSGSASLLSNPSEFRGTNVFLRNRESHSTELISRNINGDVSDKASFGQEISSDGEYVAFGSLATNIVSGYGNSNGLTYVAKTNTTRPPTPANLHITSGTLINGSPAIVWDTVQNATSYNIYRNSRLVSSTAENSFTDTSSPEGGIDYFIKSVKYVDGVAVESEASNTVRVTVDRTPPIITARLNVGKNADGWYNAPLTITFVCQDNGSDTGYVSDCPASKTFNEGADQSYTGTSTDAAGNTATYSISGIKVDTTAPAFGTPTISSSIINQNENVTVSIPVSDNLSGINTQPYYPSLTIDGPTGTAMGLTYTNGVATGTVTGIKPGNHRLYFRALDIADNLTKAEDAPSISVTVRPNAPTNFSATSPTASAPVLNWDAVSRAGIYYVYRDGSLAGTTQNTSYTDTNANEGTHYYYVSTQTEGIESQPSPILQVAYDKSNPNITYTTSTLANGSNWHNGDTTVTFACNDSLSGIATCPSPVTLSSENVTQTVTGTAVDKAGNSKTITTAPIRIDKTLPTTGSAAWSANPITTADNPTLTVVASDNLSGVARGEYYEGNDPGLGAGTVMIFSGGNLTATPRNLTAGVHTIYYRAKDVADNWSSPVSITLTVKPLVPANVSAPSPTRTTPTPQWDAVNGATRYSIQRDGNQIGTTTTTSYTDTNATEASHTYTVKAIASDGTASDESAPISVLYDKTAPTASAIVLSGNGYTHFNGVPPFIPASDNVTRNSTITVTANASDSLSGVVSGEFYLDNDPGQSNGVVMTFANGKITAQLKASNYSTGNHTIYVRSKDAAGNWSIVTSFKIRIT